MSWDGCANAYIYCKTPEQAHVIYELMHERHINNTEERPFWVAEQELEEIYGSGSHIVYYCTGWMNGVGSEFDELRKTAQAIVGEHNIGVEIVFQAEDDPEYSEFYGPLSDLKELYDGLDGAQIHIGEAVHKIEILTPEAAASVLVAQEAIVRARRLIHAEIKEIWGG